MTQPNEDMDAWDRLVRLVIRDFVFLEADFQFKRKGEKRPFVWYESNKIRVGIYYEESRHELDLSIARLDDDPRKLPGISPGELMLLADRRDEGEVSYPVYGKTEEALEIEVPRLAEILRKYGAKTLKNDLSQFEQIEQLRRDRIQEINEKAKMNLRNNRIKK